MLHSLLSGGDAVERRIILSTIIIKCVGFLTGQPPLLMDVGVENTKPKKGGLRTPKLKLLSATTPERFPTGEWKNGVSCFFLPYQAIGYPLPTTFDPSLYFTQLPDMKNSKEKICVMVTPMLRGSTFFIRGNYSSTGNYSAANPPEVCHLLVQTASQDNIKLSLELYKYAMTSNEQDIKAKGTARSQVWQQRQQ